MSAPVTLSHPPLSLRFSPCMVFAQIPQGSGKMQFLSLLVWLLSCITTVFPFLSFSLQTASFQSACRSETSSGPHLLYLVDEHLGVFSTLVVVIIVIK